jgi:hypothetical protein
MTYHQDNTIPRGADWIWVFGSNLAGQHGKGAAKIAHVNFGAKYGVGEGPTGKAYAIPTKTAKLETLPLNEIKAGVANFIDYAKANPKKQFFVTRVGCVLAGHADQDIGPLFAKAGLDNLSLPEEWRAYAAVPFVSYPCESGYFAPVVELASPTTIP